MTPAGHLLAPQREAMERNLNFRLPLALDRTNIRDCHTTVVHVLKRLFHVCRLHERNPFISITIFRRLTGNEDPPRAQMIDQANHQIAPEHLDGFLDKDPLQVMLPRLRRM